MPINQPKYIADTTKRPSTIDNEPDSNGDSSDVNKIKFGAAHAHCKECNVTFNVRKMY